MQEEVENRTLTLVVSGTKLTGRLFKAAIAKYMAYRMFSILEATQKNHLNTQKIKKCRLAIYWNHEINNRFYHT